jgi:hypothetical protein
VLVALAEGRAPTGALAAEHHVARSTLQHALERLLADQQHAARIADGRPALMDPLLAEWLRQR